ncbi:sarcosine oxidase subunit alpha family protein [Falsiroseomonas sp. HW251]|uniref:sarcosine oxidase subunit alpha family protein n=1 Tax=Falsiroseomonas sp. HW251 TaxID=3390998 RepID=UPI003D310C67
MTGFRLPAGGMVDRARALRFRFDGRDMTGLAGDTLASALLANGVRVLGRSFKYHRPRGVVTAGPEEPCALVELRDGARREPNTPATVVELFDGLVAASQNRWPSLRFDIGAVNGLLSPLLPAGFYYKTFKWPASWWENVYEPLIRHAAGLGRIAAAPDPDRYEHVHAHCDVLVVGAGPAGLAAARMAAEAGARVILAEQDFAGGGGALLDRAAAGWAEATAAALPAGVLRTRMAVVGAYGQGVFAAVERVADHVDEPGATPRQRLHVIRARRAILATGATERLVAFPGNDRPGVMLTGAAVAYARRFGVAVGRRVAVFTLDDSGHWAALALAEAGIDIAAILDPREESAAAARSSGAGLRVLNGWEACGTDGAHEIHGLRARRVGTEVADFIQADALLVAGGRTPEVALAHQAGLTLAWDATIHAFVPQDARDGVTAAGAARGVFGLAEAAADGARAARAALASLGFTAAEVPLPGAPVAAAPPAPIAEIRAPGKAFVDLQHDVTADDLRLAVREGYAHAEHAKRYTTHGMATDQGRIGGLVGAAVIATARDVTIEQVGLPRPRPFVRPVAWGALAGAEVGQHFKPERRVPLHDWHEANGAVFVRIGLWLRPLVYSVTGDTSWRPVLEEARNVRRAVGLCDVSSLGKVDVQGPDAATFLDRIYANTFSTLPVGRARYGLMLREDGMLFDDGTTSRLGPDHFLVTTTTQKADDVLAHMEWHLETVWPELDVTLTDVADNWAQFAVAGPRARGVLRAIVDRDLSNDAFPFMAAGEAIIAGVPGRLFRISFSGELAYEVAVPATRATEVWGAILAAGAPHGIRPYALDALNVLRIEKGHVTGGEINGQTTPADLGLGKLLKKKGDFVGRALGERPGLRDPQRLQLVGIQPARAGDRLRGGAHLRASDGTGPSQGYVTAACMAAEEEGWIGLALLAGGAARHGEVLTADSPVHDEAVRVVIGSPHRVDPENARVRA